jgi:hypothetical protein
MLSVALAQFSSIEGLRNAWVLVSFYICVAFIILSMPFVV